MPLSNASCRRLSTVPHTGERASWTGGCAKHEQQHLRGQGEGANKIEWQMSYDPTEELDPVCSSAVFVSWALLRTVSNGKIEKHVRPSLLFLQRIIPSTVDTLFRRGIHPGTYTLRALLTSPAIFLTGTNAVVTLTNTERYSCTTCLWYQG